MAFDPDAYLAGNTATPSTGGASGSFDPDAYLSSTPENGSDDAARDARMQAYEKNQAEFGGVGQQVIAGLEGVAQGFAGPLAPAIERAIGIEPENIRARAEANPITHGVDEFVGFGVGALAGTGEAALLGKAGEAVAGASGLGTIGSAAVRGATEMALLQSGDEVSKMILQDPNQSAQTAAINIGLAGLMGVGGGAAVGAVSPLWKATIGDKAGQFLEDFRGRFRQRIDNPNPVESLTQELTDLHTGITNTADEVYGPEGLKARDINAVMPEMSPKISNQVQEIDSALASTISDLGEDPHAKLLARERDKWQEVVTNPDATPGQIFDATQKLKQQTQEWSKFNKALPPPIADRAFVSASKDLSFNLRNALEDSSIWGKAADRQKAINKAFSDYLPTLKDFQKKFMTEIAGEKVIDPTKVNTYVNQLGKPNAEIKQQVLDNFIKATEKYKGVIADTHANLGIENPFPNSSMSAIKSSLEKIPAGAKLADVLINRGIARLSGEGLGAVIGGTLGHFAGSPGIGALVGEHALGPFFSSVLPAIAKPMMENPAIAEGFKGAVDYGIAVAKGERLLNSAMKNIFKSGAEVLGTKALPNEKSRSRLDKALQESQNNPESLMKMGGSIGSYLPGHNATIAATSMNAINYLNNLRPKEVKNAPLDTPYENPFQKEVFNRALNIAQQPLIVLQHLKDGELMPQDKEALQVMYPALYSKLCQKITSQIIDHTAKGEDIPYRTQVGLSMFLGSPLDSTMSQQSILAAQMAQNRTAAQQQAKEAAQAQASKPRGRSMKALDKVAESYQTASQARESQMRSES